MSIHRSRKSSLSFSMAEQAKGSYDHTAFFFPPNAEAILLALLSTTAALFSSCRQIASCCTLWSPPEGGNFVLVQKESYTVRELKTKQKYKL